MKCQLVSLPSLNDAAKRDNNLKTDYIYKNIVPSPFLLNWGESKKFCLITYGCQANIRDSEIIRSFLLNMQMSESTSFDDADLIIFNTCAIRENAENHLFGDLGRAKKRYLNNKDCIIAICGCVVQQEDSLKKIINKYPYVRLIFGTNNIDEMYTLLEQAINNHQKIVSIKSNSNNIIEGYKDTNLSRGNKYCAFVNINYGCDKFCTYCIVPYTRGKERSRKKEDILKEVDFLIKSGYKQITLLGQNVNAYGKDFDDGYDFASLLEDVAKTGIQRVRFVTPYPSDFKENVFSIMEKYDNIMPFLHLPVQSGSNRILKLMNRRYTREEYLDLVNKLRSHVPNIALSTDIIVGFPQETEEDFNDTLSLINEVKYDSAFTFIFSPRHGTPAYKMKNQISDSIKHERFNRLKDLIDKQTEEASKKMVGQIVNVLFEKISSKNQDMISGYDEKNKLVHVKANSNIIGQIKKVRILESHTYSLIGEIVD